MLNDFFWSAGKIHPNHFDKVLLRVRQGWHRMLRVGIVVRLQIRIISPSMAYVIYRPMSVDIVEPAQRETRIVERELFSRPLTSKVPNQSVKVGNVRRRRPVIAGVFRPVAS